MSPSIRPCRITTDKWRNRGGPDELVLLIGPVLATFVFLPVTKRKPLSIRPSNLETVYLRPLTPFNLQTIFSHSRHTLHAPHELPSTGIPNRIPKASTTVRLGFFQGFRKHKFKVNRRWAMRRGYASTFVSRGCFSLRPRWAVDRDSKIDDMAQ